MVKGKTFFLKCTLSAAVLAGLTACFDKKDDPTSPPVVFSALEVVSYDTSTANIKVKGTLQLRAMTELNVVDFYGDAGCVSVHLGQGVQADFAVAGVPLQVSSTVPTQIYLRTNTQVGCYFVTEYKPDHAAPPVPVLTSTTPASPSRVSHNPAIFGTAAGVSEQVRFYTDALCASQVGAGTTIEFRTTGINLSLPADQTSHIYARSFEPFGNASPCADIGEYIHSTAGPAAPAFAATVPPSPSNASVTPAVQGTVPMGIVTVEIYSDAACTVQVGTGTTATFTGAGIAVTAAGNAATDFYAKALDADGVPSDCTYLTTFVNDIVAPAAPTFALAAPASPTRATMYPRIKGTTPADGASVKLYDGAACTAQIGAGPKADFEGAGVLATVVPNATTSIYATSVDAAGNASVCTALTDYTHDTLPPPPPVFSSTFPISPNNQSVTPYVVGNAAADAVTVSLYRDDLCTIAIGSGPGSDFGATGIPTTVPGNAITTIYGTTVDNVGNVSACAELTVYAHSTLPAPPPAFLQTVPASPSRLSFKPYVLGTAPAIVSTVRIYSDSSCLAQIGAASRLTFSTSGVQVTLPQNTISDIYAVSTDVYGNDSPCTSFTTYIHNNVPPLNPAFTATLPASPNNVTPLPYLKGTTTLNPASVLPPSQVSFYDSFLCLNRVGYGPPADFAGAGIATSLGVNATTNVYARVSDAAGNQSSCTFMADYTYVNIKPGKPLFISTTPASPSYTRLTKVVGALAGSANPLPIALVTMYSDAACTSSISSGPPSSLLGAGIALNAPANTTTSIYADSRDIVGNVSICASMTTYLHSDLAPANLTAVARPDGSVALNWLPDSVASPTPKYVVKRSLKSGGPYTILTSQNLGSSYLDMLVSNNTTYYYVVAATNNTGTSMDSAEVMVTVAPGGPVTAGGLSALGVLNEIQLSWTGYNSDMTFQIYRSTQRGGPYSLIARDLTGSIYIDKLLTNGVTYYYVLVASNPAGTSLQSNEASAVPQGVPDAPTNLSITPVTSTGLCGGGAGIIFSWSVPAYYSQFYLRRGRNSAGGSVLQTVSGNTAVDCAPEFHTNDPKSSNFYWASATWGAFESARSNQTGFANVPGPALTVSPGNAEVKLNWTNANGADSFTIKRSLVAGGPYTVIDPANTSGFYTDTAVTNGVTYYYLVEPSFLGGTLKGFPSFEQSGSPAPNPGASANLVLTVDPISKKPVLSWSAPANYNTFVVLRAASAGGPYTVLGNSPTATYADTAPLAGMNYYRVATTWGSYQSAVTNTVSFRFGISTTISAVANASNITLTWAAVTGASTYTVYRGLNSGGPYSSLAVVSASPYADSAAAPGLGYFYVVAANFADGSVGQNSAEVSGMRTSTNIPSGLTVTATTASSVTLTWAKVTSATAYKVYRSLTAGGVYGSAVSFSSNTGQVNSLNPNTTYYFKVTSVVGSESVLSNSISAATYAAPTAPTPTVGNNLVDLTWLSVTGALSYAVERSTDGVNFAAVATGVPSTTFQDTTALNGQIYFYRLKAVFSSANLYSPVTAGVTPGVTPLKPSGLTIIDNSTGTDVTLAWGRISGVTTYNVYISTSAAGPWTTPAAQASSNTGTTLAGLTAGTTYYSVVSSRNGTLESTVSSPIAFIPTAQPPAPVVTAQTTSTLLIAWTAVPGVATYTVQRTQDLVNYSAVASGLAAPTFTDSTVTPGQGYAYRYLLFNAGGIQMGMSVVSPFTSPGISPLAPTQLAARAVTTSNVQLDWTQVSNATSYNIYRGTASGGPYTKITNVAATATTYSDTGVSPGNIYYYIVTAINVAGAESLYSNEQGVNLLTGPATLTAANVANSVHLVWAAVGGAVSYTVRRAEKAGGPYGEILSGAVASTYDDSSIDNGTIYYYVVDAVYASGALSAHSPEAVITAVKTINLQVPIEMTDTPLASPAASTIFERTRTSLDPTAYDGTVTYFIEAVATNNQVTPLHMYVVDGANLVVGTLTIPGMTVDPTRLRTAFTPHPGADTYRLSLEGSTPSSQLQIFSSRMLVNQVGASKTKIYFPLLSSAAYPSELDDGLAAATSMSTSYAELNTALIFRRSTSALATIDEYNAWTLETLVEAAPGTTGTIALSNYSSGGVVQGTESQFSAAGMTFIQSPLDEGAPGFGVANENEDYQIVLACQTGCAPANVSLYKAGLWVSLSKLTKAEIIFRNTPVLAIVSSNTVSDLQRSRIDATKFSNPTYYFQAAASMMGLGTASATLMSTGNGDSGTSGLTAIGSSTLTFGTTNKSYLRSGPFPLNTNDRYVTEVESSGVPIRLNGSAIIVRTTF